MKMSNLIGKLVFILIFSFLFLIFSLIIENGKIETNSLNLLDMAYEFMKVFLIMALLILIYEKVFKKDFITRKKDK